MEEQNTWNLEYSYTLLGSAIEHSRASIHHDTSCFQISRLFFLRALGLGAGFQFFPSGDAIGSVGQVQLLDILPAPLRTSIVEIHM
jgi:hypothetical protein